MWNGMGFESWGWGGGMWLGMVLFWGVTSRQEGEIRHRCRFSRSAMRVEKSVKTNLSKRNAI